jgi:hypothetical protein
MYFFPIGIKHAFLVSMHRSDDTDPGEHRRPAAGCDEHQGFHRVLPFRSGVFGLGKLGNVVAGVLERDELAAAGQVDRFVVARCQPIRPDRLAQPFIVNL